MRMCPFGSVFIYGLMSRENGLRQYKKALHMFFLIGYDRTHVTKAKAIFLIWISRKRKKIYIIVSKMETHWQFIANVSLGNYNIITRSSIDVFAPLSYQIALMNRLKYWSPTRSMISNSGYFAYWAYLFVHWLLGSIIYAITDDVQYRYRNTINITWNCRHGNFRFSVLVNW